MPNKANKPAPSLDIFSANLSFLMQKKGVKLAKLARDMDLTPWRIDRWLTKKCYPKYDALVALCDYFEYYDIYALLTRKID